ncbi:HIT family protein [Castellaniella hirudinis]|uniref:HIT family protein n=1 Tax=Castellaniella hirudinis TaxID=1144617 RepID=UPI0039C04347
MPTAIPSPQPACPLCPAHAAGALWEDTRLRVIAVDEPLFPGYIRVIWREHAAEMTDLPAPDRDHLMATVYRIEALQRSILQPDKINLASLGNQVPHLHWHLIPRWRDDPCFPNAIWAALASEKQAAWARRLPELQARARGLQDRIRQTMGAARQP